MLCNLSPEQKFSFVMPQLLSTLGELMTGVFQLGI